MNLVLRSLIIYSNLKMKVSKVSDYDKSTKSKVLRY